MCVLHRLPLSSQNHAPERKSPAPRQGFPGKMKAPVAKSLGLPGDRGWVWVHVQASWSVCARSGFDNGAIVRFPYCNISAMTLLRQHINQHFSVRTKALARIQPETARTLAFA
jgi:hypothetical protein